MTKLLLFELMMLALVGGSVAGVLLWREFHRK